MHNQNVKLDEWGEAVVKKYNELCKHVNLFRYVDSSYDNYAHIFASIRKQMIDAFCDEQYIVDVLIKELYLNRPNSKKVVFWNVFGDIVVQNILINTRWTLICKNCGNRYYVEEEDNGLCNLCRQQ